MNSATGWSIGILVALSLVAFGLIWVALELRKMHAKAEPQKRTIDDLNKAYTDVAEEDVNHLFNKQFREELRNRGRLRFEKIIGENAMFLKHDLDLTVAQLNEYLKAEVSKNLEAEFADYAKAMNDAQELALESLRKTATEVEEQRAALSKALKEDVALREEAMLKVYEDNMAQIIEHYVLQALSDQFDIKAQLPYIMEQMDANKENIIKDMHL
jgi:hypothetical protein